MSQSILIWTILHTLQGLGSLFGDNFICMILSFFSPKLIFKIRWDIFIVKIQKVLRTQWVLPVSGPGHLTPSQSLPPLTLLLYFLQIALGYECSDELGPCPSSHAAHRPCVPHIEIDLGSTSMSEGGFLVLLDDCIKFLCLRQGRKERTRGDHYCNCCVSAEKRTCSF